MIGFCIINIKIKSYKNPQKYFLILHCGKHEYNIWRIKQKRYFDIFNCVLIHNIPSFISSLTKVKRK